MVANVKVDEAEFVRLYNAGFGPQEIATALNIHVGATRKIRLRLGLPPFRREPRAQKIRFDTDRFLDLYERGFTSKEIAAELGVRYETVNKHRNRLGLPPCRQPEHVLAGNALPRIDRDEFKDLVGRGYTNRQVAEALQCSVRYVCALKAQLGVSGERSPGPYPQEVRDIAGRMLEDGASYNEVARTVGVGSRTVSKWFPGRGWNQSQAAQYRKMKQRMDLLDNPAGSHLYS